jgi:hypothetical protein
VWQWVKMAAICDVMPCNVGESFDWQISTRLQFVTCPISLNSLLELCGVMMSHCSYCLCVRIISCLKLTLTSLGWYVPCAMFFSHIVITYLQTAKCLYTLRETCIVKWVTALAVATSGREFILETEDVCIYENLKNYYSVFYSMKCEGVLISR